MPPFAASRCGRCARAVLIACLLGGSTAHSQDVTEPSLKAAFVYNFAKFTEWPQDVLPPSMMFTACVLGDDAVSDALARIVKGRLLDGRAIRVIRVGVEEPLRLCHLLYVSGVTSQQLTAIVAIVKGASVLTIGDHDEFGRLGGVAHMFVENGRVRFALNLDLARRLRLELSSRMVTLASRVDDGPGGAQR
jgi:hypothetical protein